MTHQRLSGLGSADQPAILAPSIAPSRAAAVLPRNRPAVSVTQCAEIATIANHVRQKSFRIGIATKKVAFWQATGTRNLVPEHHHRPALIPDTTMTRQATRPLTAKGHAFAIDDHSTIADWAAKNHYRVVVALDHGTDDEDYEEVVELRFGSRCLVLIWRDADGVVVQPLIGRPRHYGTVPEALGSCSRPTIRKRPASQGRLLVGPSRSGTLRHASV